MGQSVGRYYQKKYVKAAIDNVEARLAKSDLRLPSGVTHQ